MLKKASLPVFFVTDFFTIEFLTSFNSYRSLWFNTA